MALLLSAAAGGLIVYFFYKPPFIPANHQTAPPQQIPSNAPAPASEKKLAHLYFIGRGNDVLTSEDRVLPHPADTEAFGSLILNALVEGPLQDFIPTIPKGASLRAFFIEDSGIAYADFSGHLKENHHGGSEAELLTIYSIVNSLVLNIPEINMVKILIDGHESTTLAGHLDIRFPLKANMLLIR